MNKALISVRAKAITANDLKHYQSCVDIVRKTRLRHLPRRWECSAFVFGFVRPVLLGHDRHWGKENGSLCRQEFL
jgi:hypothetical protein